MLTWLRPLWRSQISVMPTQFKASNFWNILTSPKTEKSRERHPSKQKNQNHREMGIGKMEKSLTKTVLGILLEKKIFNAKIKINRFLTRRFIYHWNVFDWDLYAWLEKLVCIYGEDRFRTSSSVETKNFKKSRTITNRMQKLVNRANLLKTVSQVQDFWVGPWWMRVNQFLRSERNSLYLAKIQVYKHFLELSDYQNCPPRERRRWKKSKLQLLRSMKNQKHQHFWNIGTLKIIYQSTKRRSLQKLLPA